MALRLRAETQEGWAPYALDNIRCSIQ